MIILNLPRPPTKNRLYYNGSHAKTKAYRQWCKNAGWEIIIAGHKRITGPVEIEIALAPDTRGDTGNYETPTTDLLVTHGIIVDDSPKYIRQVLSRIADDVKTGMRVTVREVAP